MTNRFREPACYNPLSVFKNPFRKQPDKKGKAKPDPKGKPVAGSKPAAKSGASRSAGKGSGGTRNGAARGSRKGQQPLPPAGMSLDRKLDIIGILLVFVGLITGLSLFASQSDIAPLQAWLNLNRQLAGWGVFGLPLAFIGVGLWLVLRRFGDRLPKLEPERIVGLVMLYLGLLITLHFLVAESKDTIFDPVAANRGGGLIGAVLLLGLLTALGTLGSAVLLVAWWIIAIVFTLGLSVPELILLVAARVRRVRGRPVERQLPLPRLNERAARDDAPPDLPPLSEPAPRARPAAPRPAASAKAPKPEPAPAPPRPEAERFPEPLTAPASSYDQPLVIGGDQPWELPALPDMLDPGTESGVSDEMDRQRANLIEHTLSAFGAPVKVVEVNRGPTITQFGVEPDFVEQRNGKRTKVKVGKIASLADDLALALSAQSVRIEAPVPGKGYVGIEVPNPETSLVALRDIMESDSFDKLKGTLRLGLGQDVSGSAIAADRKSVV